MLLVIPLSLLGQGRLSGDFMMQNNFYDRDSVRGAANTPHYDNYLSGTDAWLNLNYSVEGFDFKVRFDAFQNSNLHDPQKAYSELGIGFFQARKSIENLTITGGYFYDQIGSGLLFRAYEERALGIDNAILGAHLQYDFNEYWRVKGFAGRQKNRFSTYEPIIKGGNLEGRFEIGEDVSVLPGVGVVNRTLDQNTMERILLLRHISETKRLRRKSDAGVCVKKKTY
jgi:hypothetical protein